MEAFPILIKFFIETDHGDFTQGRYLPFIPHAGMQIDIDGEYRPVDEVFYKSPGEGADLYASGEVTVWFAADLEISKRSLKKGGWEPA